MMRPGQRGWLQKVMCVSFSRQFGTCQDAWSDLRARARLSQLSVVIIPPAVNDSLGVPVTCKKLPSGFACADFERAPSPRRLSLNASKAQELSIQPRISTSQLLGLAISSKQA